MESEKQKRDLMVDTQLIARGISDKRVLLAMRKVPRDEFFPPEYRNFAYFDEAFHIGEGQTISQPYMVAKMTECLELKGSEKVLEVGTGSGYQAAILAELAKEVYTIERIEALSERAKYLLANLDYKNIVMGAGDGTYGWKEFAPYDRIIVTAGAKKIPPALIEQLSEKRGILVIPVGGSFFQHLKVVFKDGPSLVEKEEGACQFVPLVGECEYE